jgi:hypothetical protein
MSTGIQIGGVIGKNGAAIVVALKNALNAAIQRGQNDVAKSIAANIASLGGATHSVVSGCNIQQGRDDT